MKKIIPILIVGILVLGGLGAVALTDEKIYNEKVEEKSIVISEPVINDIGQYVTVDIEEATTSILEPGKPMLPVVTEVFTFPFGTKIRSVDVIISKVNEQFLPKEIQPTPEPKPLDVEIQAFKGHNKDLRFYETTELYPSSSFSYKTASGLENNEHVVYLIVSWYPVRYSPAKNMIYYSENTDIKIKYEASKSPIVFEDVYDLVVIAPSEYSVALQPLVDHKNSFGIETTIKTTEAIFAEYEGYDEIEEIKYFIQDAIENWGVKYVLLVGSVDKLPIRTTWIVMKWYNHYWNESILTELYYADVYDEFGDFCSWDSDGDGRFGEVYINSPGDNDTVDLYPDVHIGRLACSNIEEVNIVVDKIIYYENNTFGQSWFNNILLLGGDTFPHWNGNEGEILNLMIEEIMSDFNPTKLWCSTLTFWAWKINQEINKGVGFVDYSGHGVEDGMGTHPPNSNLWIMYQNHDLKGLYNTNKLPIVFFDACLTAKLDYNKSEANIYQTSRIINSFFFTIVFKSFSRILKSILERYNVNPMKIMDIESNDVLVESRDGSDLVPCFAWNWIRKSNGGAIANIGATRTAFGGFDSGAGKMSIEFFSTYESFTTIGEMWSNAQIGYNMDVPWDLFTLEEFILLGDPSLVVGGYQMQSRQR
ncbi:MAG: hypothetical protein FK733_16210 [Asgard group archaeon]|nr:hypothetical protein [Asgard group archaeon]